MINFIINRGVKIELKALNRYAFQDPPSLPVGTSNQRRLVPFFRCRPKWHTTFALQSPNGAINTIFHPLGTRQDLPSPPMSTTKWRPAINLLIYPDKSGDTGVKKSVGIPDAKDFQGIQFETFMMRLSAQRRFFCVLLSSGQTGSCDCSKRRSCIEHMPSEDCLWKLVRSNARTPDQNFLEPL